MIKTDATLSGYDCWLRYDVCDTRGLEGRDVHTRGTGNGRGRTIQAQDETQNTETANRMSEFIALTSTIVAPRRSACVNAAIGEIGRSLRGLSSACGIAIPRLKIRTRPGRTPYLYLGTRESPLSRALLTREDFSACRGEGFIIKHGAHGNARAAAIVSETERGLVYGTFRFLRGIYLGEHLPAMTITERPAHTLRMLDHWDNPDGTIERGYAGESIFFKNGKLSNDFERITDYSRLLASVGINGVVLNNVNVREPAHRFITDEYLPGISKYASVFRSYGIRIYLSINFASPVLLGGLPTADPLDADVRAWWKRKAAAIYRRIPDFGGFLVKADSEFNPGPYAYGRDHADGANMLAAALAPFDGTVIWRCFVYNCVQDWRNRKTDRARAAYDTFMPLDGRFADNVVLQIKNGPMDFQVREPVSPLFGGLEKTNHMVEFQVTQEYTGQQKHLCFLVPIWKETFDFETYAASDRARSPVKQITAGKIFPGQRCGCAGVANVGNDRNWTGHDLAQANLYGFGRLAWNPDLASETIAREWATLTFGHDPHVVGTVASMLVRSRDIYERYTTPLGLGWMVNPGCHYGPNPDGYEYSKWGTYHRADSKGIGIDRSVAIGTGCAGCYRPPNAAMYETIETCPEELLLFFHRVEYMHRLKSGKTLIQHVYDSHFEGAEQAGNLLAEWKSLEKLVDPGVFARVRARLEEQIDHAREWRDVINSYFYRKSGIADERGRVIH